MSSSADARGSALASAAALSLPLPPAAAAAALISSRDMLTSFPLLVSSAPPLSRPPREPPPAAPPEAASAAASPLDRPPNWSRPSSRPAFLSGCSAICAAMACCQPIPAAPMSAPSAAADPLPSLASAAPLLWPPLPPPASSPRRRAAAASPKPPDAAALASTELRICSDGGDTVSTPLPAQGPILPRKQRSSIVAEARSCEAAVSLPATSQCGASITRSAPGCLERRRCWSDHPSRRQCQRRRCRRLRPQHLPVCRKHI